MKESVHPTVRRVPRGGDRVHWVYVTAPDVRTAKALARNAVRDRLAACANVIPEIRSIYRWNGRLEESGESALLLKTTRGRLAALVAALRAAHPYECPCIVQWPLAGGHPAFLEWVRAEANRSAKPETKGA